jgi:hypothetical protein
MPQVYSAGAGAPNLKDDPMTFCTPAIGAVLTSKQSEEKEVAAHYRDGVLPEMRSLLILKEAAIQPSSPGAGPSHIHRRQILHQSFLPKPVRGHFSNQSRHTGMHCATTSLWNRREGVKVLTSNL